jgi:hypothetical protein
MPFQTDTRLALFARPSLHRIVFDVLAMLLKALVINNLHIRVPALPNFAAKPKLLAGAKRKASFDQLHRLFKSHLARNGHQNVDMIGHNHEVVNGHFSGAHIGAKNFDKSNAMRSVWKSDLPPAVRVVTKNVRGQYEALDGSEGREGIDIAGAKALHFLLGLLAARLKSCPDASQLTLAT